MTKDNGPSDIIETEYPHDKIWDFYIVSNVIYFVFIGLALLFSLEYLVEAMYTQNYSRDNQTGQLLAWVVFGWIAIYPLLLLLCVALVWYLQKKQKFRIAFVIHTLPFALLSIWFYIYLPLASWKNIIAYPSLWWWLYALDAIFLIGWIVTFHFGHQVFRRQAK